MLYTITGYWDDTQERYAEVFDGFSALDAEDAARGDGFKQGGRLWVSSAVLGEWPPADCYTRYVDPDDERNPMGLVTPLEDLEPTEYTVTGLILRTGMWDRSWNARTGGTRFWGHFLTTHPRYAEDIAAQEVGEGGHQELWVCAVFPGFLGRAEAFDHSDPRAF